MISSGYLDRSSGLLPIEMRLLRQAKTGDINAFVELCVPCAEWVYRYIHFLVPNNRVAEGLTLQVFFKAWEQLDRYHMFGSSFLIWLYSIARVQVKEHHRTHKLSPAPDNPVTLASRGDEFREEYQIIRDGLRILSEEKQNALVLKYIVGLSEKDLARTLGLQTGELFTLQINALIGLADHLNNSASNTITREFRHTLETCLNRLMNGTTSLKECLLRHPQYSSQLEPILETALLLDQGRDVRPLPAFINYTQEALTQFLRLRPRRSLVVPPATVRRLAVSFAMLTAAFLATGTAYAQAAMPGDAMYGWKRASEQVWQTLAPHSVTMDIMLAERRLDEWIAVQGQISLEKNAEKEYQKALTLLEENANADDDALIAVALQSQQQELARVGLSNPVLDEFLLLVSASLPENANPLAPVQFLVTATPTVIAPAAVSTEEVTDTCPPKCGAINGNSSNSNSGSGNNNAGGNNNNAGDKNNVDGNDDPKDKDKDKPDEDNSNDAQDKNK